MFCRKRGDPKCRFCDDFEICYPEYVTKCMTTLRDVLFQMECGWCREYPYCNGECREETK